MRVALFVPCFVDVLNSEVAVAVCRVLARLGHEVVYPEDQTCCGQPALNSGYHQDAECLARRLLDLLESAQPDAVVSPSGSCVAALRTATGGNHAVLDRLFEFSEFLTGKLGVTDVGANFPGQVTWHDACHPLRELGIRDGPRRLLQAVSGLELLEMDPSDECCGFGGTFAVKAPLVSTGMGERKIRAIEETGAEFVSSTESSCLMQIEGLLERRGSAVRAIHLAEILEAPGMADGGSLSERIRRAVNDPVLPGNVLRATNTSLAHRRETVAERDDWEDLRDRAAKLRDHVLANLDRYLEEFVDNARARGAHVHFATDAAAARRIITELARKKGATRILKSKSMATEEVELNQAFTERGFTPLETDLGEFIVQLRGEPPSHITAPALHCSAEQIRDLFKEVGVTAGEPPSVRKDLATWLSLSARSHLRDRLLEADLGITGASFLVAETGTVALVENEGNIRLTTTSAPVTICLAGIDKLLPKVTDLATMLPLLTRSATGQRMTAYFSMISGALEEQHIVLLDNGRIEALASAADREVLRCIRCGACMNVCPVYRTVGGHAYGWTYPGPIGSLLSPMLRGRGEDHQLPFLSSLCGACTDICPVKIPIHEHLLRMREQAVAEGRRGVGERVAFKMFRFVMRRPGLYRLVAGLVRQFLPAAARAGILRPWTDTRAAPTPAKLTFKEMWKQDGPRFS